MVAVTAAAAAPPMIASVADVAEAEEICPPRGIPVKKSHSSRREDADEDAECCDDVQR